MMHVIFLIHISFGHLLKLLNVWLFTFENHMFNSFDLQSYIKNL